MSLQQTAWRITRQFEEGISLALILEEHGFENVSALGEWMAQQSFRWNVEEHRYERVDKLDFSAFEFDQPPTHQRLNENELFHGLEEHLGMMRKMLQGAFPVQLTATIRHEMLNYCERQGYTADEFIERAIVEQLKRDRMEKTNRAIDEEH